MCHETAMCIGCGCTDDNACLVWFRNVARPCQWARVDRSAGLGVCSACHQLVDAWDAGDRTVRAVAA